VREIEVIYLRTCAIHLWCCTLRTVQSI